MRKQILVFIQYLPQEVLKFEYGCTQDIELLLESKLEEVSRFLFEHLMYLGQKIYIPATSTFYFDNIQRLMLRLRKIL